MNMMILSNESAIPNEAVLLNTTQPRRDHRLSWRWKLCVFFLVVLYHDSIVATQSTSGDYDVKILKLLNEIDRLDAEVAALKGLEEKINETITSFEQLSARVNEWMGNKTKSRPSNCGHNTNTHSSSSTSVTCQVTGLCHGHLMGHTQISSYNQCLTECDTTNKCAWFTFEQPINRCYLFTDCISQDKTCDQCMSGEAGCLPINEEVMSGQETEVDAMQEPQSQLEAVPETRAEGVLEPETVAEDPPVIKEAPANQKVKAGGIAAFLCVATGHPTPHITWRQNGNKVSLTLARYQINDFPGGSLLRIEPVMRNREDSQFECVAENGVGDPVSAVAKLEVFDENNLPPGFPKITENPSTVVVEKGHNKVLVCKAEGDPVVNIYWVKDTMPLAPNPRFTVLQQGSLQIKESHETDQGKYECVAENYVGTVYSNAAQFYVRVRRDPPRFSIPPEPHYEVMSGASLNITCVAVGRPMPYVKWRKGTADVTPELTPPIGKNVLVLEDISVSANYTCVAASKLGIIQTSTSVRVQG